MSGSSAPLVDPDSTEARALLLSLEKIELDRFTIVGTYLRFDERTRSSLKDLRQRVIGTFHAQSLEPRNFLIWGAPGSGKSYLVQQISGVLDSPVQYRELNLAQLTEREFHAGLQALESLPGPLLCLLDEIDAKPGESWPYEMLLPHLEPPKPRAHRACFCLAASGGKSIAEMREGIHGRPKGRDLLSRIPAGNEFVVPALTVGDKMLVSAVQLLLAAKTEGRDVREIEKLALYFIAVHPAFASARQLRSLAAQTAQRIPLGEDRIRFDDLFAAGDPENKRFWASLGQARAGLADTFLHLAPGTLVERTGPPRAPASSPARPAEGLGTDASRIVVLPFTNISPDAADEYFADGMTEELIERLAHVSGLRVIARTTAMHYKNSRETALEIGRELHVGAVVECSVRKAGNRLRITAQLIDTKSEEHLWSSRYDRELHDIFAVQDEIAGEIATSLTAHIPGLGPKHPLAYVHGSPETGDMEAYTAYLHGRKLLQEKGSETTIQQAATFFETAVRRDPKFARAKVGVAECILYLGGEGVTPYVESTRRARELLTRALAQDDTLAEAHSVLGGLLLGDDDHRGADREARRAIELNPSLSDPYRWLAQLAAGDGNMAEAIRLLEAASQIDPVDVNVISFLGRAYAYGGREADALTYWERTMALVPFRTNAHLAEYYLGVGDYVRAEATIRELERLRPDSAWTETFRGILAARRGDVEGAKRALHRLEQRAGAGELTVFHAGFVYFALGEMDDFVACMERAFDLHALPLMELLYSPLYESARSDPRIIDLLRRQREFRPGRN